MKRNFNLLNSFLLFLCFVFVGCKQGQEFGQKQGAETKINLEDIPELADVDLNNLDLEFEAIANDYIVELENPQVESSLEVDLSQNNEEILETFNHTEGDSSAPEVQEESLATDTTELPEVVENIEGESSDSVTDEETVAVEVVENNENESNDDVGGNSDSQTTDPINEGEMAQGDTEEATENEDQGESQTTETSSTEEVAENTEGENPETETAENSETIEIVENTEGENSNNDANDEVINEPINYCSDKNFSAQALLYHVSMTDGRCVWSCSLGTTPNFANQECVCKEGLIETSKDQFGRRVCTKPQTPIKEDDNFVQKKKMALWLDINNNGKIDKKDVKKGYIRAFNGPLSSIQNYNWYSWSAHPVHGPKAKGFESHVWLYEGSDGLTFNFFHNVDAGGSKNNRAFWHIKTTGNQLRDNVILSDDPGEVRAIHKNKHKGQTFYHAKHQYWKNTDGAVLGPFLGEDFQITVKVVRSGDLIEANFYSENGEIISLKKEEKIRSFIINFESEVLEKKGSHKKK